MLSTLICITRRYCSGFSSTTLPRLPIPTLLSRKSSRPPTVDGGFDDPLAVGFPGDVAGHCCRCPALSQDHFNRAFGQPEVEIGHQHLGTRACQQDCRRPAVANAVARSTAATYDGHSVGQAGIVFGPLHHASPFGFRLRLFLRDFASIRDDFTRYNKVRGVHLDDGPPSQNAELAGFPFASAKALTGCVRSRPALGRKHVAEVERSRSGRAWSGYLHE